MAIIQHSQFGLTMGPDLFASWSIHTASHKPEGSDDQLLAKVLSDGSLLLALADGATGHGFGRLASSTFIEGVAKELVAHPAPARLHQFFIQMDFRITELEGPCDTTAIVVAIRGDEFVLASIGDSRAWMIFEDHTQELTLGQPRKPRVGSGCYKPWIVSGKIGKALLLASDGFEVDANWDGATAAIRDQNILHASQHIAQAAIQKQDGQLFDDLGLMVCRFP